MVSFEIPNQFQDGQGIPFKISGGAGAAADTYKIIDDEGNQVELLGTYIEDNDFPDTIEGTIEDASSSQYTLIAYGSHWVGNPSNPASMREMWDKELARFRSNKANVLPSQEDTSSSNSDSSGSNGSKSEIKDNPLVFGGILATSVGVVYLMR